MTAPKKRTKEYIALMQTYVKAKYDRALIQNAIHGTPLPTPEEMAREVVEEFKR